MKCYKSILRCLSNRALFLYVDAIKELADVLVLNEARLVHQGTGPAHPHCVARNEILRREKLCGTHEGFRYTPRHILYAVALEEELVLDIHVLGALDTLTHGDGSDDLLTQEVTDGELVTPLLRVSVDGEMRIHQTHLVPAPPQLHWSPRQDIAPKRQPTKTNGLLAVCMCHVCCRSATGQQHATKGHAWLHFTRWTEYALVAKRHASDHVLNVADHCS